MTAATKAPAVPFRSQALACLREGRVQVGVVQWPSDRSMPHYVVAMVTSSREPARRYKVELSDGLWWCACLADNCGHRLAVRMVTGHAPARPGSDAA